MGDWLTSRWPAGLLNRFVPMVGVVVTVLMATPWAVSVYLVDLPENSGILGTQVRLDRHRTYFELFDVVPQALGYWVPAFVLGCLLWWLHRSRVVVSLLAVVATPPMLVIIFSGDARLLGAWLTLVSCVLVIAACVVDARVRRPVGA